MPLESLSHLPVTVAFWLWSVRDQAEEPFRESRLAAFARDIEKRDARDYGRAADLAKHLHDAATFAHVERVAARVRASADPARVGRAAIVVP